MKQLKKILLVLPFLFLLPMKGQEVIKLTYEQTNFNPIPENMQSDANFKLAANMYNDCRYEFELIIQGNESLWKRIPHIQDEGVITFDGVLYDFDAPNNSTFYRNSVSNETIYSLYDKRAIKDSLKSVPWEIEKEKFSYFGYEARKAFYDDEYGQYVAFYTTDLPYRTGPMDIAGLPGLILYYKLQYKDGFTMEYAAKKIETIEKTVDFNHFAGFELITLEEYLKEHEERKELREFDRRE